MWRKGNPLTLLMGMQTSTDTMENSVESPQRDVVGREVGGGFMFGNACKN